MMQGHALLLAAAVAVLLSACSSGGGGGDSTDSQIPVGVPDDPIAPELEPGNLPGTDNTPTLPGSPTADCSVSGINQWVDGVMRDIYLFYDQVPVVDPLQFESPEALLDELRVTPPDSFTFITTISQNDQQQSGELFRFGVYAAIDEQNRLRVTLTDEGSPAQLAGVQRGEIWAAVNGIDPRVLTPEQNFEILGDGTADEPRTAVFTFINPDDNSERELTLSNAAYQLNGLGSASVLTVLATGLKVGYLPFHSFIPGAAAALTGVFAAFDENAVSELVVDLRYNPGGRTSIAHQAASLVGGDVVVGEVLEQIQHNDRYAEREDRAVLAQPASNSLGLSRVVFLVTGNSASSSELLINALKPYIEVTVIGSRTLGKPFQSIPVDNCDQRLFPLIAESVNAAGESVRDGIAPDCAAADDLNAELGDPGESMLSAALGFITEGSCAVPAAAKASSPDQPAPLRRANGERLVPAAIME